MHIFLLLLYNVYHVHRLLFITNDGSTVVADGNAISFADIWSEAKLLDEWKRLSWWWPDENSEESPKLLQFTLRTTWTASSNIKPQLLKTENKGNSYECKQKHNINSAVCSASILI